MSKNKLDDERMTLGKFLIISAQSSIPSHFVAKKTCSIFVLPVKEENKMTSTEGVKKTFNSDFRYYYVMRIKSFLS
jgi:hypothetical protein